MFQWDRCDYEALYKDTVSCQVKCKECKDLILKTHEEFNVHSIRHMFSLCNNNQSQQVDLKIL